jgi:hypothetical protein
MEASKKQAKYSNKEQVVEYASQKVSNWPDWKRDIATKIMTTEKTSLVFSR